MADSHYEIRGQGNFASVATLSVGAGPLDTVLNISSIKTATGDSRKAGEGVMLGTTEICRVLSVGATSITVSRGCADTIPQPHVEGTPVWFFDNAIGTENFPNERASGTTVGVKLLPTTVGGGRLPLSASPPNQLTFNFRFARPYPPGRFKINSNPWTAALHIKKETPEAVLTWTHRDRVLQADQLVAHEASSVGPEPGTTYTLRVYDADDNLKRTVAGITGTTWTYTGSHAQADFGIIPDTPGYMTLCSVRDGLESMQRYRADFLFTAWKGYGFDFDNNWGGNL